MPAALLAIAPKCVLCLFAYAGLGTILGAGGPELCGAVGGTTGHWVSWLAALAVVVSIAGWLVRHFQPRSR
jgi:hypothetical protein